MLILIQRLFCSPISASLKDGALSRQRSNRLCESVPLNTLVLTEPINSETIVREHLVAWSVAGGSGLKCPTPQKRRYRNVSAEGRRSIHSDCQTRRQANVHAFAYS